MRFAGANQVDNERKGLGKLEFVREQGFCLYFHIYVCIGITVEILDMSG